MTSEFDNETLNLTITLSSLCYLDELFETSPLKMKSFYH